MLGDFNKHHALWAGPLEPTRTNASDSESLLALLAKLHMDLCTPPGQKTFFSEAHKTWSTLNLVFSSESLTDLFTRCDTAPGHGSNHMAIQITIDTTLSEVEDEPRHQFCKVD